MESFLESVSSWSSACNLDDRNEADLRISELPRLDLLSIDVDNAFLSLRGTYAKMEKMKITDFIE